MQDADDSDGALVHPIENDVLARAATAHAGRQVAPSRTKLGTGKEVMHGSEAISIEIPLLRAPGGEGVFEQRPKVGLSFLREFEPTG